MGKPELYLLSGPGEREGHRLGDKLVGAEREKVRLLRLCPHRPPGQRGGAGREVGAVDGDEPGAGAPLSPHTLQKRERRLDYELTY